MTHKLTRREALVGVSSTLLLPAACGTNGPASNLRMDPVFSHGVASGDPDVSSVVLWTRISGQDEPLSVNWEVAQNPDFRSVLASGTANTSAASDFTVKVIAMGLPAGQRFFYRFSAAGSTSPVGRTKTLPVGQLDELVIAVTSCSNYQFGFFNAYEAIAEDDAVDIVVHLGDYLYEYDMDSYGGPIGQSIDRVHNPTHEMVSLADYRLRHAQYKTDECSRAMHARHPLIATWDDHETTNNPWKDGAQNHQVDEGSWDQRRQSSLQAYYEWMPVREPAPGKTRAELWRHYPFGDLLSLITLESRHTARSQQVDIAEHRAQLNNAEDAHEFYRDVVGDPQRRLLSDSMEDFLRIELQESISSGRRWRIIANQTIMARVTAPSLTDDAVFANARSGQSESGRALIDELTDYGKLELAANMDAWDGYPAARERFYNIAREAQAQDLLVITGDTHLFWQNSLTDEAGRRMGIELGTSAVTSPRGFYQLGPEATRRFDELTMQRNPEVHWMDGQHRGYIRLTLTRSVANAEFIAVTHIESRRYAVKTMRSTTIRKRNGSLSYT